MTGGPLTILQVTHQGGPAGSTQSIFNLSQYLNRRGHRVLLGCRGDVLLARLAREAGLPVVPLVFTPRRELTRALGTVLAREGVDVINSHATLDRRALTWLRWRGRLSQAFVVTRRTMPRSLDRTDDRWDRRFDRSPRSRASAGRGPGFFSTCEFSSSTRRTRRSAAAFPTTTCLRSGCSRSADR